MAKSLKIPKGIRHSLWSVMDAALYPAVSIATVPVMIHALGLVAFGLWVLLNSLITILQLFNFNSGVANMGMATIRNITQSLVNGDTKQANDIVNSTLHITSVLFFAIAGVGFVLSLAAVKYRWWGLGDVQGINISLCILLAAIIAGLKYFDQVFQTIIKAHERFRMSSVLNMIYRFGSLTLTLLMAVAKYALVDILWANIAFLAIYIVLEFFCVRWTMTAWHTWKVSDIGEYKKLLHFSKWPWLQAVMVVLTFQTDRFWVSSNFGLKEVSGYGLVSTIFNHIHMIFTAMALWVLPRISAMAFKGEDPAKLYYMVRGIVLGIIVVSLLLFYYVVPLIMPLWAGADTAALLVGYIKYFTAFEIVFAHSILPFFYLNAIGKDLLAVKLTLFYCTVCYVLMIAGLYIIHTPMAMVTGMTIAMCITMPVVNGFVQREMYRAYSVSLAVLEMLPMYAAIMLLYNTYNLWTYVALVLITAILLWRFYLSNLFNRKIWQRTPYL